MDFPSNLKHFRQMNALTQKQMADCLGMSERGYRNYEIGQREPNLSDLVKIADLLNVSLDALIGRDFPKSPLVDAE